MGAILSEPVTALFVERLNSECWVAGAVSMQGWRRTHEDAHLLTGTEDSAVFAVLDGHGGQTAANIGVQLLEERLSRLARRIASSYTTGDSFSSECEIQNAFIDADARLREQMSVEDRSGSTVVAAVLTRPRPAEYHVLLAHAGDSRAVVSAGDALVCTDDHKPNREDENRRIVGAGGFVQAGPLGGGPPRVDGSLAVSRAIGDFHFKPAKMEPKLCKVTCNPDVQRVQLRPGDWMLIACDGVFDVVTNEEVGEFIRTRLTQQNRQEGCDILAELLQLCLNRGSKDNCTALLVQLQESRGPVKPPAREMLKGGWDTASPEIQGKYVEFFKSHGFEGPTRGSTQTTKPVTARTSSVSSSGSAARTSTGSSPSSTRNSSRQAVLTKAIQAMRSSRAIQNAWRNRRSSGGNSATAGSAPTRDEANPDTP